MGMRVTQLVERRCPDLVTEVRFQLLHFDKVALGKLFITRRIRACDVEGPVFMTSTSCELFVVN